MSREEVECVHCDTVNDISKIDWSIGRYKGMKTKTFECANCKNKNHYSENVNGNLPEMFEKISGVITNGESK